MKLNLEQTHNTVIVTINGRLDTVTSPDLDKYITPYLVPGVEMIFDCTSMEYISSAGLRVILKTHKDITARGGLFVVKNLNNEVRSVFDITGFLNVIKVE